MVSISAFACIIIGMLVAVIQPYKAKVYNIVDTVLILSVSLAFVALTSLWIAATADPHNMVTTYWITSVPLVIPPLYMSGYLVWTIGKKCCRLLCCNFIKLLFRRLTYISENTGLL